MSQNEPGSFKYFISRRDSVLVVTFVGQIGKFSVPSLTQCQNEIEGHDQLELVVLYFRDVPEPIAVEAILVLTQLQMKIRRKGAAVSICALNPKLKEQLLKMGVVRPEELSDNLQAALSSKRIVSGPEK